MDRDPRSRHNFENTSISPAEQRLLGIIRNITADKGFDGDSLANFLSNAIESNSDHLFPLPEGQNPFAVIGGRITFKPTTEDIRRLGGLARAAKLTPQRRTEIAKAAVDAREAKRARKRAELESGN
ncbi:MAG TPA: hypothetical protein VLE91_02080 [Candidatus Saccharimonadales bacterium]|nr:hypothetical protein [Candidatus Saccharimonadales bacterium]